MSPHRLTWIAARLPYSATRPIRSRTAGLRGSISFASAPFDAIARSYILRRDRSDPIEKNAALKRSIVSAAAGTSTMMPERRKRGIDALG